MQYIYGAVSALFKNLMFLQRTSNGSSSSSSYNYGYGTANNERFSTLDVDNLKNEIKQEIMQDLRQEMLQNSNTRNRD